jgi:hypothetical protein
MSIDEDWNPGAATDRDRMNRSGPGSGAAGFAAVATRAGGAVLHAAIAASARTAAGGATRT